MYIWLSILLQLLSEWSPCIGYERVALPSATFLSIVLPGGMWVQVNHVLCSYITRWFIIFIWRHGNNLSVVPKQDGLICVNRWWRVASESGMRLNAMVMNSVAFYPWFLVRTKIWAHRWAVTGRGVCTAGISESLCLVIWHCKHILFFFF